MGLSRLWCAALLFALIQLPGQNPPWTPGPAGQQSPPLQAPTLPIDAPRQAPPPAKPKIDTVKATQDAKELAKLAGEIPAGVEQANKGVVPKELNDRLKRIEKLSKQLRRELFL